MRAAQVTKSSPVLIRPSESEPATPSHGDAVALSSFDKCIPPFPIMLLLTFQQAIHEPVETIKTALSRALAHYRPLAGRLDGRGGIACTGEGVAFVGASAGCALEDDTAVLLQMDLTVRYPGLMLCRDADPLLLVQVTEFSCGGFVVGVTWNHLAADGAGMGQFLHAVGELARGVSPPSVVPVRRWDDSLPNLATSTVAEQKSTLDHRPQQLARLDVVVPASLIKRIKAGDELCTVFEAVTAVIWRCRTRAAMSPDDPDSPAPLTFVCNARAHVGARAGYYGNCVSMLVVPATSGMVANSGVGDLVRLIRRAKEKVPDSISMKSSSDGGVAPAQAQAPPLWYEAFTVTSWRNLSLDAADFGGGTPARVLWHAEQTMVPGCVVCPPCKRGRDDGVDVSTMCVKPEHVDAFLGELTTLAAASA